MHRNSVVLFVVWSCLFALPLAAQEAEAPAPESPPTESAAETPAAVPEVLTPRESFDRVMILFGQAHPFTSDETQALGDLRDKLVDSGDRDLAADLDLLRIASTAQWDSEQARIAAQAKLAEDSAQWSLRENSAKSREFWRSVRDGGLVTFTTATISALLLASVLDQNDAKLKNGFFFDWKDKEQFQSTLKWALAGSASTMFLSLFPLLWGEARQ